jgi:hypothetical protein
MEKIYIILFLSTLFCTSSSAQEITKVSGKKYSLNNVTYHFDEMEPIFDVGGGLDRLYRNARKSDKIAKGFGYFTLGAMGVGVLAPIINPRPPEDMYCDLLCLSKGAQIGLISLFIVVPVSGTIALTAKFRAKKKRNRLIKIYNRYVAGEKELGYDNNSEILLKAGATPSGVGVTLTF